MIWFGIDIHELALGYRPGHAPFVLAPAALAFLAAISDDSIPVAVGFLLIFGHDLEREALALRKCRPAVEEQRRDAHDRHLNHQRFALLAVGIVAGGSLDAVDPGVGECRGVQLRCFLCVMIVPEAHLVLGGHLSVSSLRSPVVQRFPGPTRPKAAPSGSMPSDRKSTRLNSSH